MTERSVDHYLNELEALTERFRQEYENFTYVEIVGCLECFKSFLLAEVNEIDSEEGEEEL